MAEDVEKAVKRADKRLHKIMRRYGIADAVKEIGEAMRELDDLEGVKLANAAVTADLPGGDVAQAVFSVVKNDELHDLLNQDEPGCESNDGEEWAIEPEDFKRARDATWPKCAEAIDRFRDKVSAYYGFSRELIVPVSISDAADPLLESAFTVLGIGYKVSGAELTCVDEVQ
nr:MAG TPA: hypothetical protein [Caudoviricetes sp.]